MTTAQQEQRMADEVSILRAHLVRLERELADSRQTRAACTPPQRLTLRVPRSDTNVRRWWDSQDDSGASTCQLIRQEIERNGLNDTVAHSSTAPEMPDEPTATTSRPLQTPVIIVCEHTGNISEVLPSEMDPHDPLQRNILDFILSRTPA